MILISLLISPSLFHYLSHQQINLIFIIKIFYLVNLNLKNLLCHFYLHILSTMYLIVKNFLKFFLLFIRLFNFDKQIILYYFHLIIRLRFPLDIINSN